MQIKLHWDGGLQAVETSQDVSSILESNAEKRKTKQQSDWGREIADIPNVIYVKWLNEEWAAGNTKLQLFTPEFDEIVRRKLRDPEWAYLRTDSAQVQGFMGFGS